MSGGGPSELGLKRTAGSAILRPSTGAKTGGEGGRWERMGATTLIGTMLLGLLMWLAGATDFIGGSPLLSLALLLGGGIQAVWAGFVLLNRQPSGRLVHSQEQATAFCLCCGIGVACLGFAISPLTPWLLPALFFAAGGLALIIWAPQALARRRQRDG